MWYLTKQKKYKYILLSVSGNKERSQLFSKTFKKENKVVFYLLSLEKNNQDCIL